MAISLNLNTLEYFIYENNIEKNNLLHNLFCYSKNRVNWIKEFKETRYTTENIIIHNCFIRWENNHKIVDISLKNETYIIQNAFIYKRIIFDNKFMRLMTKISLATILNQPFIHDIDKPMLANQDLIKTIAEFI